jgi:hypothetical protein
MTVLVRSFQARTLSPSRRPRASADHCPRRVPARSRVPAKFERHDPETCEADFRRDHAGQGSDDGSLADAWRQCSHGKMLRPECGRRPIEKARDRFPGAGSEMFCDDGPMPVICPTCQLLFKVVEAQSARRYRGQAVADADCRLALPPHQPRLHRIIAVEPAQLVVQRRRHELRQIAGIDPRRRGQPAQEITVETCIVGWRQCPILEIAVGRRSSAPEFAPLRYRQPAPAVPAASDPDSGSLSPPGYRTSRLCLTPRNDPANQIPTAEAVTPSAGR